MDIIRENEDKIIKIRIRKETENEDGFITASEELDTEGTYCMTVEVDEL